MTDELDDTDPDVLRDRLLEQAERGDITNEQAEAAAGAHGLEQFERKPERPRFDPMLNSDWSIVMAVAWIARRDFELVREQDPEFCSAYFHWIYRKWKDHSDAAGPVERAGYFLETRLAPTVSRLALLDIVSRVRGNVPSIPMTMTMREAEAGLWRALSEGRLVAVGFNANGAVVEIPPREWVYLRWREERGRDALRYDAVSRPEPFTAVTLRRSDLLRLWPVTGECPIRGVATKAPRRSQAARIKQALFEIFPAGVSPNLTNKQIQRHIVPVFKGKDWKLPSIDTIARARRKAG